jgi:nucleotidyltransferase/DNA polymerase involved in DNA repair
MNPCPSDSLTPLLRMPGIGPSVIRRLEEAGIASLSQLRQMGVERAVLAVCERTGQIAHANRRRCLQRALDRLA